MLFGQACSVPSGQLKEIKRLQLISGDGGVAAGRPELSI